MKKLLSIILTLLFISLLTACSDEDRSFTIDQVKIDAQIEADGVIQVRELYTYTFDGAYEGMTRSIHSNMSNFHAYETTETNPNGDTDELTPLKVEEDEDDDQMMRIYTDSENETKSVLYSYEVNGSVNKYADVADVTYAFFDESNETDLNNVEIITHLPEEASQKDFHVFLHSNVRGEMIQTSDRVQYKASALKKGETSEMRLIYPAEQMTQMDIAQNKEKGKELLKEERVLASKGKHLDEKISTMTPWVLLAGVAVIITGIGLLIVHPNRYRGDGNPDHLLPIVESTDPLFLKYLDKNENLDKTGFIAGLISLKQRGIITLQEVPSLNKETKEESSNDKTLRFTYVDETAELDQADDYLIEWLFKEKDKQGRYFLLDSIIVKDNEPTKVIEEKAERFEKHFLQWSDLVKKRETYQNLRTPYNAYGILSTLAAVISYGFIYYVTKVDLISSAEQLFIQLFIGLITLGAIFFNKNKWVISAYYLASLIVTVVFFSTTDGRIVLVALQIVSWLMLITVPAYVWRMDLVEVRKAIHVAYREFKTKRYPIGANYEKVERRLEYAIVLGAGKEYGEACEKEMEAEHWDVSIPSTYPLLNNPAGVTTMFDPGYLILYSAMGTPGTSYSGSSSTSSTGGGGAGAF